MPRHYEDGIPSFTNAYGRTPDRIRRLLTGEPEPEELRDEPSSETNEANEIIETTEIGMEMRREDETRRNIESILVEWGDGHRRNIGRESSPVFDTSETRPQRRSEPEPLTPEPVTAVEIDFDSFDLDGEEFDTRSLSDRLDPIIDDFPEIKDVIIVGDDDAFDLVCTKFTGSYALLFAKDAEFTERDLAKMLVGPEEFDMIASHQNHDILVEANKYKHKIRNIRALENDTANVVLVAMPGGAVIFEKAFMEALDNDDDMEFYVRTALDGCTKLFGPSDEEILASKIEKKDEIIQALYSDDNQFERQLELNIATIAELEKKLAGLYRKNRAIHKDLLFAREVDSPQKKKLGKILEQFIVNGEIEAMDLTTRHNNKVFVFETASVKLGRKELGRFKVSITVDGANASEAVKIEALDGGRGDRIHPHVSGNSICWGSLKNEVPRLIGERDYVTLTAAIIKFLNSWNPGDTYDNSYWRSQIER